MTETPRDTQLLDLTTTVVAAHVGNNAVASEDLPKIIKEVYDALANVADSGGVEPRPTPAVPVKRSIFPDYIVCLEDGKRLKMLKRHLKTHYDLTPEQYREKWGLPADYPMVAPNYAKQRSQLAKKIGLGTRPRGKK